MRRGWLYGLFFLSGTSTLVYELVWQRLLNLVFGVSTLSVSAVVAGFMGGLALGGLIFGRVTDRTARPLKLYAWLEIGVALSGLLVPSGFATLAAVYSSLYPFLEPGPWDGACIRLLISLAVLAVPTTLIGGTLPVMARLAARRASALPTAFSLLYGANTLGAVLGAALTGFVLLRWLGMQYTLWLAAALNLLVALLAAWASRGEATAFSIAIESEPRATDYGLRTTDQFTPPQPWLPLFAAGLTGAIGMALEVSWGRVLGILTSNSAYGFAVLLTTLLLGLGLGSFLQSVWSRFAGDPWRRLASCQWLLAVITLATLPFFQRTPNWLVQSCDGSSTLTVFTGELALCAAAIFVPGVIMGMSLPLLVAAAAVQLRHFAAVTGRIYAVNTLGSVVGAFASGFVLIPWLGIQASFGIISASACVVGLVAWEEAFRATVRAARPSGLISGAARHRLAGVGVAGAIVAGWALLPGGHYMKSAVEPPRELLYYQEGNNATVAVVQEENGARSISVDGQPVAGTAVTSVVDQKMLAHLPLLLHPAPRRALTVGFGSGGTSYSMSLHGVDVDCVEIEAAVPGAAAPFQSENHGVLTHPRFRLIVDDARSWLRIAPVRYDVIVTDCTNIQYRSNGDLYTVDYFLLMKGRLTTDGLAAAWVPANGIAEDDLKTLLRSFRAVFPHTSVWYMNTLATDFLIVVGTPAALAIDLEQLRERVHVSEVAQDLETIGLADPCRLVYTFLAGEVELATYLSSGPLNTDDRPILSFTTYGATFRRTAAANLLQLLACRTDVARYVRSPAPAERMLRHYAASNETLLGHIAYLAGEPAAAQPHYARGARLLEE